MLHSARQKQRVHPKPQTLNPINPMPRSGRPSLSEYKAHQTGPGHVRQQAAAHLNFVESSGGSPLIGYAWLWGVAGKEQGLGRRIPFAAPLCLWKAALRSTSCAPPRAPSSLRLKALTEQRDKDYEGSSQFQEHPGNTYYTVVIRSHHRAKAAVNSGREVHSTACPYAILLHKSQAP